MRKPYQFKPTMIAVAIATAFAVNATHAADLYIMDPESVVIIGNDNYPSGATDQGVYIYSNSGNPNAAISLSTDGYANIVGNASVQIISGSNLLIIDSNSNNVISGFTNINGGVAVSGTLSAIASGNSAANQISVAGVNSANVISASGDGSRNSITGTTSIEGSVNINGQGKDSTAIGNNSSSVTVTGSGAVFVVGSGGAVVNGNKGLTADGGLFSVASSSIGAGNGSVNDMGSGDNSTNFLGAGVSSVNIIGEAGEGQGLSSTNEMRGKSNTLIGGVNTITGTSNVVDSSGNNTIIAAGINTLMSTGPGNTISAAGMGGTNVFTATQSNTISATNIDGTNTLTATQGNTISATGNNGANRLTATARNTVEATGANASNNFVADGVGSSNNISAIGSGGTNNVSGTTNVNVGTGGTVNNFATNINTGTNTQAVSIGNSGMSTSNLVTARSGYTTMGLTNDVAKLTAGPTLGTNGISGTTSAAGSGGITIYNTAQTITSSVNDVVTGKQYQSRINGNLFIDGNAYINGTLDYVSRNAANTTVVGNAGTSNLSNAPTSGGMAVVMKGTEITTTQTVVDQNGKITNVAVSSDAVASESTAGLTLTNGQGNTHGMIIGETKTTMSGGVNSSSLTLDDNGATFSNASTGRPVRVHGVYDGKDDFDAVNVRQLGAGVAMASALAAMPQVDASKRFNVTAGVGSYLNASALAIGGSLRVRPDTVIRFGAAVSSNRQRTVNVGVGHSF